MSVLVTPGGAAGDGVAPAGFWTVKRWRALLLVLALVYGFFALWATSVWPPWVGAAQRDDGFSAWAKLAPRDAQNQHQVLSMPTGSPLAAAGVRVGERLVLDHRGDAGRSCRPATPSA